MDYIESDHFNEPKTSSAAILSLIFGIFAWLGIFGLGGILAIILGYIARKKIRQSRGLLTGDGLATAGLVLGYINVVLFLIGLCIVSLILIGLFKAN